MSSYYYKVVPEPKKAETYGFKKVSKEELQEIVIRLTKPTYNIQVQTQEHHQIHNYNPPHTTNPPITPFSCRKTIHPRQPAHKGDSRKLNEWELQRLLKRIQKPTRAYLLSMTSQEQKDEELNRSQKSATTRPARSAHERKKALQKLSRPTTASRAKVVLECHLCLDDERELNKTPVPFVYHYANNTSVTAHQLNSIVSRLRYKTRVSDKGQGTCSRLSPDYRSIHVQSLSLPLVSGLERTKTVDEIVSRLHSNKGSNRVKTYHGYPTMATQFTDHRNEGNHKIIDH